MYFFSNVGKLIPYNATSFSKRKLVISQNMHQEMKIRFLFCKYDYSINLILIFSMTTLKYWYIYWNIKSKIIVNIFTYLHKFIYECTTTNIGYLISVCKREYKFYLNMSATCVMHLTLFLHIKIKLIFINNEYFIKE